MIIVTIHPDQNMDVCTSFTGKSVQLIHSEPQKSIAQCHSIEEKSEDHHSQKGE